MAKTKKKRRSGPRIECTITFEDRSKMGLCEEGPVEFSALRLIQQLVDVTIESRNERLKALQSLINPKLNSTA